MTELIRNLTRADEIVRQANPHFEKSAEIKENAELRFQAHKKLKVFGAIVVGCFCSYILDDVMFRLTYKLVIVDFLPLILTIAVAIATYKAIRKYDKKCYEDAQNAAAAEAKRGEDILAQHADELAFLPVDYWYPLATGYMLKMLVTNRADDVREALNLFDEQLHRWKVEEANAQVVEEQRQQTEHLKKIRTNSAISAVANVGTWLKR